MGSGRIDDEDLREERLEQVQIRALPEEVVEDGFQSEQAHCQEQREERIAKPDRKPHADRGRNGRHHKLRIADRPCQER